jgi:hypothetical protein
MDESLHGKQVERERERGLDFLFVYLGLNGKKVDLPLDTSISRTKQNTHVSFFT